MNNNEFAIESFISFCDDMMITQESVFIITMKLGMCVGLEKLMVKR